MVGMGDGKRRCRALFISDAHLGTPRCHAGQLLDFLHSHDAELIYLVGDIVDGWRLKANWYWPQSHSDVVHELLRKARDGARIIYVPGNHDEFLRNYYGTHFGGIDVTESAVHIGLDGRRYLVVHGDHFDLVVKYARWLTLFGDRTSVLALLTNAVLNRSRLRISYGSLSRWAKRKVKEAVNFTEQFERILMQEASRHRMDGVICGHVHHPAIRDREVRYINCGDWVESCTATVEHFDGRFELVAWTGAPQTERTAPAFVEAYAA